MRPCSPPRQRPLSPMAALARSRWRQQTTVTVVLLMISRPVRKHVWSARHPRRAESSRLAGLKRRRMFDQVTAPLRTYTRADFPRTLTLESSKDGNDEDSC